MACERIRVLVVVHQAFRFCQMLVDSVFHFLLCVAYVEFSATHARRFVDDDRFPAHPIEWAGSIYSGASITIALAIHEVF